MLSPAPTSSVAVTSCMTSLAMPRIVSMSKVGMDFHCPSCEEAQTSLGLLATHIARTHCPTKLMPADSHFLDMQYNCLYQILLALKTMLLKQALATSKRSLKSIMEDSCFVGLSLPTPNTNFRKLGKGMCTHYNF